MSSASLDEDFLEETLALELSLLIADICGCGLWPGRTSLDVVVVVALASCTVANESCCELFALSPYCEAVQILAGACEEQWIHQEKVTNWLVLWIESAHSALDVDFLGCAITMVSLRSRYFLILINLDCVRGIPEGFRSDMRGIVITTAICV